jgi:hypothetical protein
MDWEKYNVHESKVAQLIQHHAVGWKTEGSEFEFR